MGFIFQDSSQEGSDCIRSKKNFKIAGAQVAPFQVKFLFESVHEMRRAVWISLNFAITQHVHAHLEEFLRGGHRLIGFEILPV